MVIMKKSLHSLPVLMGWGAGLITLYIFNGKFVILAMLACLVTTGILVFFELKAERAKLSNDEKHEDSNALDNEGGELD
ncbi:hypothetical protein VCHA53O466_50488 [Vibrio chagasii]|nr:hypothetical protein VCHA53O466_50488 [Vibrio chagasii]